ncbi:MAG TPA: citramalate synthase [Clostridia bacterium]|nr:citramalate synthase [Clostridia bacterium]
MLLNKNTEVTIIDRTIPEVYLLKRKISRLDIIELSWKLKELGADLIEINTDLLKKMGKMPSGLNFIIRIKAGEKDIDLPSSIKHCIVSSELLKDTDMIKWLADRQMNITAEFKIDGIEKLDKLKRLKNSFYIKHVQSIRITGLNKCSSFDWTKKIKEIRNVLGTKIDICAENNYSCATAVAVEALMEGTDTITASFSGCGKERGFAALEEILTSIRVLISDCAKMNLIILPEMSRYFSKVTGIPIPCTKAIIGRDIFKYESGIHADGIDKNPLTYEPFEPDIVGQKRELRLGKHSGTKAVASKLKELGVQYSIEKLGEILNSIKNKSIILGRSLLDDEILEICKYI